MQPYAGIQPPRRERRASDNPVQMGDAEKQSFKHANIYALCDVDHDYSGHILAGYPKAKKYTDFREMIDKEKEIDAVLIGTPDHTHAVIAAYAMKAGKHVFCEKAIASNHAEAEEMFRTAQERNLVLLEAVRPVFDPGMQAIKNNLYKLGAIRKANISYCQYSSRYGSFKEGQEHNIFSRECSAGALMDIGVYCVHTLLYLLGMPEKISGFAVMLRSGVDGAGDILAKYQDKIAEVSYSKITDSGLPNEIQGENGMLLFQGTNDCPENVRIVYRDRTEEVLYHREPLNDMKYELKYFIKMIRREENAESHTERSLNAMKLMDEMRRQCGITFPADEK